MNGRSSSLAAYESRRRARAAWVLEQTHRRIRHATCPAPCATPVLRWGADAMFRRNYGPLVAAP